MQSLAKTRKSGLSHFFDMLDRKLKASGLFGNINMGKFYFQYIACIYNVPPGYMMTPPRFSL